MSRRRGLVWAIPAVATLALSPVAAARPHQIWVGLCGGGGTAIPLPFEPGKAPEDRMHGSCAHATCPRQDRLNPRRRTAPDDEA